MRRRKLLVVMLVLALGGCTAVGYASPNFLLAGKRKERVTEASEAFAANLRWGRYDVAASHVEPAQRIDFLKMVQDPQALLRFTDYEVMTVELGPGMGDARALVNFKLHRLPSMREQAFSDDQTWRYDARNRQWYLVPELAVYRDAGKPLAQH